MKKILYVIARGRRQPDDGQDRAAADHAELDEYLGGIQGEFDADTRFAITWFEQNGMGKGDYGVADNVARARGILVDSVKHAGIVESQAGKVRILKRDELDDEWEPDSDSHLTVWNASSISSASTKRAVSPMTPR